MKTVPFMVTSMENKMNLKCPSCGSARSLVDCADQLKRLERKLTEIMDYVRFDGICAVADSNLERFRGELQSLLGHGSRLEKDLELFMAVEMADS